MMTQNDFNNNKKITTRNIENHNVFKNNKEEAAAEALD
jgi:hypothetical protein